MACGQDNTLSRLDARHIAGQFVSNFTGWDTALGVTLKGLVHSPGGLASDYIAGRRRRYVNPARFCLLSLALWFLMARLFGVDPLDASGIEVDSTSEDSADLVNRIQGFLRSNLELLLFFSLPLRAMALRLLFRKAGRNVAECMVMVLYVTGASFLLGTLLVPFAAHEQTCALKLRPLLTLFWSYWAALGFFRYGWFKTLWRTTLASFLHLVLTILLFAGVSIPRVLFSTS